MFQHNCFQKFAFEVEFLEQFVRRHPAFGFNGLGLVVYLREYSREKDNGHKESWWETCDRVVSGTMNMILRWFSTQQVLFPQQQDLKKIAEEMYERMWEMKWLPSGRGIWAMGSPLTEGDVPAYAALSNCSFVTTQDLQKDSSAPFVFAFDMAMLGAGIGFDTKGANTVTIKGPNNSLNERHVIVEDSREGWVSSLRELLDSYFLHRAPVSFDYSQIRPRGSPIKRMGHVAPGPEPLKQLHTDIRQLLDKHINKTLSTTTIVDIMNMINRCISYGNVRRTAQIALGEATDEFLDLKNNSVNPNRAAWGWASNNSVYAQIGMDYRPIIERIVENGEPGLVWLENMQAYGRMKEDEKNWADSKAFGTNPCGEMTLEPFELCHLVEVFLAKHESLNDFLETLKYAFLYVKTITLWPVHWPSTNEVLKRNRRIGCSISGIAQFLANHSMEELQEWCEQGYRTLAQLDEQYSQWFGVQQSIKRTCVKPCGTISLLAGSTPGMHFPLSRFYLRRVRFSRHSELLRPLRDAGYHIEPAYESPENTVVVSFPIDCGRGIRSLSSMTMQEQLQLAAFLQRHWADNQVSATITFTRQESDQLQHVLEIYQHKLKSISFLPEGNDVYPQMPYEKITEEQYQEMIRQLKPLNFDK